MNDASRTKRPKKAAALPPESVGGGPKDKPGSIGKGLAFLEIVTRQPRIASVAEVAAMLDLSKPTGHRIAATLEDLDFLKRDPGTRRLIEGDRLVELAVRVLGAAARRGPRHVILQALTEATGETCNFGVLVGGQVVYLDRVESKWPLGLRFEPGSRVPAHCTALGKMFLSQLADNQREAMIGALPLTRYTSNTITDPRKLADELQCIRDEGISFDDQEFMSGVVCMAVPCRDAEGRVFAGIAISAPEARQTLADMRRHAPALKEAARKLARTFMLTD